MPLSKNWLMPVLRGDQPAMLKVAHSPFEREGAQLMAWWGGQGAARVLAHEDPALLMERAEGPGSLIEMSRNGQDEAATRIACDTVVRLHGVTRPPPPLPSLAERFAQQTERLRVMGGVCHPALEVITTLLETPKDVGVLHGDVHHGNILDFGPRGWLAIDPQGVIGERAYDFANLLRNPDDDLVLSPGRLERQLGWISEAAGHDPLRMLQWGLAHAVLSASWSLQDGQDPEPSLQIARHMAGVLGV